MQSGLRLRSGLGGLRSRPRVFVNPPNRPGHLQNVRRHRELKIDASGMPPAGGSGIGGNGGGGGGGDGSGDDSESKGGPSAEVAALMMASGKTIESFPVDFGRALLAGKVTSDILRRFLELEANFWVKNTVWGMQGFRERLLADPYFPVKILIECGLGLVTKLAAEKTKREDDFWREIDFVCANVTMTMIADFVLTWLPAPMLSFSPNVKASNALASRFSSMFAGCPGNAFQKVQPGMDPFTINQRFLAIIRNGMKLFGVGFCASMLGVGITNAMGFIRQSLDPNYSSPNKPQNVLATSAAYGTYTSISSNLRYQFIAGVVEERGIETLFKGNHQVCHLLSVIVRTTNTFIGSLLWVDFVRLLGMQKASSPKPVIEEKPSPKASKKSKTASK